MPDYEPFRLLVLPPLPRKRDALLIDLFSDDPKRSVVITNLDERETDRLNPDVDPKKKLENGE